MRKKIGAYTLTELVAAISVISILASVAASHFLTENIKAHELIVKEFYTSLSLGIASTQAEWRLQPQQGQTLLLDDHTLILNSRGNLIGVDGHELTGEDEHSARVCSDLADYSHSVLSMSFYPTTRASFDAVFKVYEVDEEKPTLYQHTFAVYAGKMAGKFVCTYVYAHSLDPVYIVRYFPDRERAVVLDQYSNSDYFSYFSMHSPTQSYSGVGMNQKFW